MTRREFEKLIEAYKEFSEISDKFYEIGLNIFEGEKPIADPFYKVAELMIYSHYTEEGVEWIFWWIYENEFGDRGLEAYDEEKNLICQTEDELFEYVKQYEKC